MTSINEIKKDLGEKKPIIGVDRVKKGINNEELKVVYMCSNWKDKDTLKTLCETHNIKLNELDINNIELGVVCKKPYPIGVLGFLKK